MLKLRTKFHSLLILLVTAGLVVFFGLKATGQTKNYLKGQKTGNRVQSGALIGLGSGSAKLSSPMLTEAWGCALGVQTNEFRFYYAPASNLNDSPVEFTKLTAARSFGLAGLLGAGADVYLQFRNTSNAAITANTPTYFKLKERPENVGISVDVGGLLGLTELNSITATAYSSAGNYTLNNATLGGVFCPNPYNGNKNEGSLVGTTVTKLVIDASGEWYAKATPDASYNSIRLNVAFPSGLSLANVNAEINVNVYNAFTVSGATCNTLPLFTNAGEATGITIDAGAVVGGLQLSQLIANPEHAINGVTSQYSSFSSGLASVGVASTVSQSFYYDHSATANDGLHLKLGMSNSLIGLSLAQLNGITFYAYLGTSETPVYTKGLGDLATLLGLDLLNLINLGSSHKEIELSFKPGVTFDRFKIEFNKGLLGVGVIGDALRVYDVSLAPSSPTITVQPTTTGSTNICEGNSANFSVTATVPAGGTISNYQWQYYDGSTWINTGTNSNTHSTGATTLAMNNRLYRVLVTGGNATCPQTVVSNPVPLSVKALPSAGTITGNSAVCVGQNITLSNTTTGGIWTSSNTSIATVSSGVVTGIAAGTVTITYTVTDPTTLCVNSTTKSITVNSLPPAPAATAVAICSGSNGVFQVTSANAAYTYNWYVAATGGSPILTGATVTTPSPLTSNTTYYLEAIITATGCGSTTRSAVTITVNPIPTASISGTTTVCQNTAAPTVTFTAGSTGTAPYTFSYNINGGATQTVATTVGNSVTISAPTTATGSFVYNLLSVKDNSSTQCTNTQTGAATVTIAPIPTITLGSIADVCQETPTGSIPFTSVTGAPSTYTIIWDTNALAKGFINVNNAALGSSPISFTKPTNSSLTPGIYTATLTVSTATCTSTGYPVSFTILPRPPTPTLILHTNPQ